MGLMTETPWEYYQPSTASTSGGNSVDHHRENLRNLKKIQQMARMKREEEANKPLKAFALTIVVSSIVSGPVYKLEFSVGSV